MKDSGEQVIALLSKVIAGTSPNTGAAGGTVVGEKYGPESEEKDYSSAAGFCNYLKDKRDPMDPGACDTPKCDPEHACIKFNGNELVCAPPDMFGRCP